MFLNLTPDVVKRSEHELMESVNDDSLFAVEITTSTHLVLRLVSCLSGGTTAASMATAAVASQNALKGELGSAKQT